MARRGAVEAVAAGCGLSQLRVRHGVDLLAAQHTPVELLQSQHRRDREGRFAAVARDHADLAGEENNGNARPINMYCEGLLQGVPTARGLGWVDLNLERSTVCPILPGLMGMAEAADGYGRSGWARWWNTHIKVNPTQVYMYKQMGHPDPVYLLLWT